MTTTTHPTNLLASQKTFDIQDLNAGEDPNHPTRQYPDDAHEGDAGGATHLLDSHLPTDARDARAVEDTTPPARHAWTGTRSEVAGGGADDTDDTDLTPYVTQLTAPLLYDPHLKMAAEILDDLETVRKANTNRLNALTRTGPDEDGITRGLGLPDDAPQVKALTALVDNLLKVETQATRNLEKLLRAHPLGPWIKNQKGVGDKQAARLLAAIGDPYINDAAMRPRTVSQLWAYTGLHVLPARHVHRDAQGAAAGGATTPTDSHTSGDLPGNPAVGGAHPAGGDPDHGHSDAHPRFVGVAARRQKGHKANWSTTAKTRAWNVIDSCMKQINRDTCTFTDGIGYHSDTCACSPYRRIVDNRRQHTAVTHPDWTPGHSLADGKRIAMKALLKHLWRESRAHYLTAAQQEQEAA